MLDLMECKSNQTHIIPLACIRNYYSSEEILNSYFILSSEKSRESDVKHNVLIDKSVLVFKSDN